MTHHHGRRRVCNKCGNVQDYLGGAVKLCYCGGSWRDETLCIGGPRHGMWLVTCPSRTVFTYDASPGLFADVNTPVPADYTAKSEYRYMLSCTYLGEGTDPRAHCYWMYSAHPPSTVVDYIHKILQAVQKCG